MDIACQGVRFSRDFNHGNGRKDVMCKLGQRTTPKTLRQRSKIWGGNSIERNHGKGGEVSWLILIAPYTNDIDVCGLEYDTHSTNRCLIVWMNENRVEKGKRDGHFRSSGHPADNLRPNHGIPCIIWIRQACLIHQALELYGGSLYKCYQAILM